MNLNLGKDLFFRRKKNNFLFSSEFSRVDENQKQTMKLLNKTLQSVPQRGTFQLNSVLDSTYFFS